MFKAAKRLLELAARVEPVAPSLADRMERLAGSFDVYLPHSELLRVQKNVGGPAVQGDLGGLHFQATPQSPVVQDRRAIAAAQSLAGHISSGTVPGLAIQQAAAATGADVQQVRSVLQRMFEAHAYGITDPSMVAQYVSQSGPADIQLAAQNLPGSFNQMGISSPQQVMQHEKRHEQRATASPQQLLQAAQSARQSQLQQYFRRKNPKADMPSGGVGGAAYKDWSGRILNHALQSYMGGGGRATNPSELGASQQHFVGPGSQAIINKILK